MVMFAMMVVALSFTACGGDDDDNGIWGRGEETLTIDNQKCFPNEESVINEEKRVLSIWASVNKKINPPIYNVRICLSSFDNYDHPFLVSELRPGEVFNYNELEIEEFSNIYCGYDYRKKYWKVFAGSITVESVDNISVKLRFNNLSFILESVYDPITDEDYYKNNSAHTINGTVLFHNNEWCENGWVPFY